MTIRAILFDLDDTLIDWSGFEGNWYEIEPRHLRYVYDYITQQIGPMRVNFEGFSEEFNRRSREGWRIARETMVSPHIGHLLMDTAAWLGAPRDRLHLDAVVDAYRWSVVPGTIPFPDAYRVLFALREAGLELGLITNSYLPMRMRDAELRAHNLLDFFQPHRYSAADIGYLKPHANIFNEVLNRMGVDVDEAVFVGDSLSADIVGAKNVGMRAVWRMHHVSSTVPDVSLRPDFVVRTLDELLTVLKNL